MAKRSGRHLSKKGLPPMVRITNSEKERVFVIREGKEFKEFKTLREFIATYGRKAT